MLLHAGRIAPTRGWRMPLHVHPDHDELIVVVGGELVTEIAREPGGPAVVRLVGTPGTVLHYPAGHAHVERAAGSAPLETLFLGFRDARSGSIPMEARDGAGHVLHAARWMLALCATRDRADHAAAEALLSAVVHELGTAREPGPADLVRRVQRYVEYHLADPLTLERLAEEAGMSKFHFSRAFAAAAGMGPMGYVRQARVNAARTLLATSALPLRAIASLVGFADQTQLSRVFRRLTRMTPGDCRGRAAFSDVGISGTAAATSKGRTSKRR